MGKKLHKPRAVHNLVASNENTWCDPRTRCVLATGAIQNWPSRDELAMIDKEYAMIRAAAESEEVFKHKKAEKANAFE